jgi:hypothetical protein
VCLVLFLLSLSSMSFSCWRSTSRAWTLNTSRSHSSTHGRVRKSPISCGCSASANRHQSARHLRWGPGTGCYRDPGKFWYRISGSRARCCLFIRLRQFMKLHARPVGWPVCKCRGGLKRKKGSGSHSP